MHASVLGHVLLGNQSLSQLRRLYPEPKLERLGPNTPETAADLFDVAQAIRRRGYGISEGAYEAHIATIAVPVADVSGHVVAATHGRTADRRVPRTPWGQSEGQMKAIAIIGAGAIGRALIDLLRDDCGLRVSQVVVPARSMAKATAALGQGDESAPRVVCALDVSDGGRPNLVVECAGHSALTEHVVPALAAGIPAVVTSIGALHDGEVLAALEAAACAGQTRVELISGAVGGIDALAAARIGGLEEVVYTGRKPPEAWEGTPAAESWDLARLRGPTVIFEGSAREAARRFPRNANVAATVSLAGIGLDRTRAWLIADPGVSRNVHQVEARGAFGRLDLTIENFALPGNPKTSALTVYSIVRAVRNFTGALAL